MLARFKLTWQGQSWHTGQLTGDELCALEEQLGIPWGRLQPVGLMRHRLAILATFLTRERGEAEVAKLLGAATLDELDLTCEAMDEKDDMPTEWEDGLPLEEGRTSTPT